MVHHHVSLSKASNLVEYLSTLKVANSCGVFGVPIMMLNAGNLHCGQSRCGSILWGRIWVLGRVPRDVSISISRTRESTAAGGVSVSVMPTENDLRRSYWACTSRHTCRIRRNGATTEESTTNRIRYKHRILNPGHCATRKGTSATMLPGCRLQAHLCCGTWLE